MKNDSTNKKDTVITEEVVIPDECGDTLWDAVLQQEVKSCDVKGNSKNAAPLFNRIDAVSRKHSGCDATAAK